MKTKKLTYTNQLPYDYANIQSKLQEMALKGWKCTKFSNICIHYEKIEPQELKYDIIFIPSLSQFDGSPTGKEQNLISMCEEAGWEYVCQWDKAMVFCSSEENPTPIETDELLKLENIHKSMKKEYLPFSIGLIFLLCISCFATYKDIYIRPEEFFGGSGIFHLSIIILLLLNQVLLFGQYTLWYKASKKSVEQDGKCAIPTKISKLTNACLTLSSILYLIFFFQSKDKVILFFILQALFNLGIIYAVINWLRKKTFDTDLKKKIYFGLSVIILTLSTKSVFYLIDFESTNKPNKEEVFPLEIQEIQEIQENTQNNQVEYGKFYHGGETFLLKWGEYNIYPIYYKQEYRKLYYSIYESDYNFINQIILSNLLELEEYEIEKGLCWNQIYDNNNIIIWEEDIPYENSFNNFIVQTNNGIFEICFSPIFSDLEIKQAIQILLDYIL